jgi:hypothetical protein
MALSSRSPPEHRRRRKTGGGNDGLWEGWENDKTVFPPFPQTLEIAKGGDSHIPTATTTTEINREFFVSKKGICW